LWTKIRSVLEDKPVERLLLDREDTHALHEESVKGHDTLANVPSPLKTSLDPIPFSRDERFSGPKLDQLLATPCWAHKEGPEH